MRYFLALPAGIVAAWAFFQEFKKRPASERAPFLLLSVTVAVFAISNAASLPQSGFALARVLNDESFLRLTGFPVQFLRGLLALAIVLLLGWCSLKSERRGRGSFLKVVLALALLTTIGLGWCLTEYLGRQAARDLADESQEAVAGLVIQINNFLQISDLAALDLAEYPAMAAALVSRKQADFDRANALLDRHRQRAGATTAYYLLDGAGLTIASSNRAARDSFVGKSYAFRPYFTAAIAGRPGKYFALGVTSGERGYYAGAPVADGAGRILGVVAVKNGVDTLARSFAKDRELFLVSPEGVIFISGSRENLFRALWPVDAGQRAALLASRQFGAVSFEPLLEREPSGAFYLRRAGVVRYVLRVPIGVEGWSVVMLLEATPVSLARMRGIRITFLVCGLFTVVFMLLLSFENTLKTTRALSELRRRNEEILSEQLFLLHFVAEIRQPLQSPDTLPAVLQQETEIIVNRLNAAFARIWTLNRAANLLELQASAGMYTHLDGAHARIPIGRGKIGKIAQENRPFCTNAAIGDPGVLDQEWARREGMQAFAGYPLRVEGRAIGVLALFARQPLKETVMEVLGPAADSIASYIERNRSEAALLESEQRFRGLFDRSRDAIMTLEPPLWQFTSGNPAALALFGARNEEHFMSLGPWEISPELQPDGRISAETAKEMIETAMREGKHFFEWTHQRIDGQSFPTTVLLSRIELAGKTFLQATVRDITERKKLDDELRDSAERYRVLTQSANDAIVTANDAGTIVGWNQSAERMFGYREAEVRGRSLTLIIPRQFHEAYSDGIKRLQAGGEPHVIGKTVELVGRRKDGGEFELELSLSPWVSREGHFYTGIIRDITGRKRTEEALREKTRQLEELTCNLEQKVATEIAVRTRNEQLLVQQSKMAAMGEMLGAIAHQWRQPLNTLGMCVQNIGDACAHGDLDRPHIYRTIKKSMDQIQHMSTTIDDFRIFFLPDKERSRFDAMAAVGDVLSLLSAQLKSNDIAFRLTCHTHARSFEQLGEFEVCPEKTVEGYRNELEHVLLNLIINARDAIATRRETAPGGAPGPGLITFDFFNRDGAVVIEVGDNGTGIPEAILPRIFEPYFTMKDPSKGTGIGLYMSKIMIEEHMKGNLTATNGPEGAIFSIRLQQAGSGVVGPSPCPLPATRGEG
ncbi:MAG: PAS domain S-box protein [Candidatus Methylomirabilia bacterium]